jgi:hypothetical protein
MVAGGSVGFNGAMVLSIDLAPSEGEMEGAGPGEEAAAV